MMICYSFSISSAVKPVAWTIWLIGSPMYFSWLATSALPFARPCSEEIFEAVVGEGVDVFTYKLVHYLRLVTQWCRKDKQLFSYQQRFSRKITFKRPTPPHFFFSRISRWGVQNITETFILKVSENIATANLRKYLQKNCKLFANMKINV